uniref:Uncharacterized protein LOC108950821 n=1 Tax=Phallusia mammillata TaxID=59560 RepID=A0A6F9DJG1_9ASCI|nr:uncharacterized protein LOC108950821 [Phallusia mammillata]
MKRCWDQDPTKRPTMTEIKEELKNLLEKQNSENLLSQVASVAREMVVNQPSTNESQRVPLHYFSPRTGRFEVPSTTSSRTIETPTEPPAGAQEQGFSQQGEIPTSSRSQQPDSIEGTESKEANTSIEITQPKTSTVEVSRENPQPQHPDSSNPASTGFQRLTESTEESSHSSKSPQQHALEPTGGAQEQVSSPSQQGEISTDQTRPARTLVKEIPHSSTSPQQPAGGTSTLRKAKQSLRKLFGFKTENHPTSGETPDEGDDFNQLVQKYVDLLKTKKYDEAKTTKQQLSRLFESQPVVTAEDLKAEATKFGKNGKYLEAILFASIAADFYVKKNPDSAVARSVANCAWEIQKTIELLMKNSSDLFSKLKNREIVRNHVIPLMRDMILQIRDLQIIEKIRCEQEVWCLHHIEMCQLYIGDLASGETTIKLGLELMETKFGNESSKYQIYGILLNILGHVCEKTSRIKEAVEYFTKAIEVYKTAKGLPEEKRGEFVARGREEWIARSEKNLQKTKQS